MSPGWGTVNAVLAGLALMVLALAWGPAYAEALWAAGMLLAGGALVAAGVRRWFGSGGATVDDRTTAPVVTSGRAITVVLRPGDPPLTLRASRRESGAGWVATVCVDDSASGHPVAVAVFAGEVADSPATCLGSAVRRLVEDDDADGAGLVDRVRQRFAAC